MRRALIPAGAAAAAALATAAVAGVVSNSGSGPTRAHACTTAKNAAGILATRLGETLEYSRCECSDSGDELSSYRWSCSVDAYYRPWNEGVTAVPTPPAPYDPAGRYGNFRRDSSTSAPGVK